jgi:hypothetical protein
MDDAHFLAAEIGVKAECSPGSFGCPEDNSSGLGGGIADSREGGGSETVLTVVDSGFEFVPGAEEEERLFFGH